MTISSSPLTFHSVSARAETRAAFRSSGLGWRLNTIRKVESQLRIHIRIPRYQGSDHWNVSTYKLIVDGDNGYYNITTEWGLE